MAWLAITFQAEARVADAMADALIEAGAISVNVEDRDAGTPDEAAQFGEPGMGSPHAWPQNVLTVLAPIDCHPPSLVGDAARACRIKAPPFTVSRVEDEDWVRKTQLQFEPILVSAGLWIVPTWCTPPEPTALNIRIDPGLAFGTGSHPTTRLVLRWLAQTLQGGESVLDYGCGSGILTIAAARLGAQNALGVDIDSQALLAATHNAAGNDIAARFFLPEDAPTGTFDIVVANILANPLVSLAPTLAARTLGRIALSGILASQRDEVEEAYLPHFEIETTDSEDGWVLLTGKRR